MEMRVCWSCGNRFNRADRHCPSCGSDSWNPPQGINATLTPPTSGGLGPIRTGIHSNVQYVQASSGGGQQSTTAAGILILATLTAFGFWFGLVIGFINAINPPDLGGSAFSMGRASIAFFLAIVGTCITWALALRAVEE